jgi:hypothetical protein
VEKGQRQAVHLDSEFHDTALDISPYPTIDSVGTEEQLPTKEPEFSPFYTNTNISPQ